MADKTSSLIRLNRAIALTGFCSRRKADSLIVAGKIKVNGKPAHDLNTLVNPEKDILAVDDQVLTSHKFIYVLLNKPKGVITSCLDERGRQSIIDLIPHHLKHLKPAGRLDRDSAGLLLLTNDGSLIYSLTHPTKLLDKTYLVTVAGQITDEQLHALANGIRLSDGLTSKAKIRLLSRKSNASSFTAAIHEGKNRQLRRMCSSLGLSILSLTRIAIGRLQLDGLKPGAWRQLSNEQVSQLLSMKT